MDDIWGDDEAGEGQQGLDREWQARRGEHYNSGYREGLEAGKHETVQEGFNQGYAQGATAGWECGAVRGAAATLRAMGPRVADLAARLQDAQQQQQQQQREVADWPYQHLQRRVCESLMAAEGGSGGSEAGQGGASMASPAQLLAPDVASALQATRASIEMLGLHVPAQRMINGV